MNSDSYQWMYAVGSGGFGSVWKAVHKETGEVVAIKCFHEATEVVWREAFLMLSCADNPGVVEFRRVIKDSGDGRFHLVMEFGGASLRDVIIQYHLHGGFPETEVRAIVKNLCHSLVLLHSKGIIHRDIKPANILVSHHNNVWHTKLCDLGLAVFVDEVEEMIEGKPRGTSAYMSPERLDGTKYSNPCIDMWSVGCVMAEMLIGKPLFDARDDIEQIANIISMLAVPDGVNEAQSDMDVNTEFPLRKEIPETCISNDGFEVLRGLLDYKPESRLSALQTLHMEWFGEEQNVMGVKGTEN